MIYIIGQGCYSDWTLVGYTDNKELADREEGLV